jgi:hypothetical protein
MKTIALPFACLASIVLSPMTLANDAQHHAASNSATIARSISTNQAATRAALRDLWVEHVFWIRNYVTASAANNANEKKVAAEQVVANAKAIAGAVGSFYGQPAADRMLALLAGHWGAVQAYSDASFKKDAVSQQAATSALLANAMEIASFLAKANPNLPESTLVGLLSAHGAHHIAQTCSPSPMP